MRQHSIHSDVVEVFDRRSETDGVRRVGSPRLELERQNIPRRTFVVHELDHVAARLIRRHLLEHFALSNKAADSHRPQHLVTTEGVKVDAQRIERNGKVWGALRAVADEYSISFLSYQSSDLGYRIDCSQGIRDVIECDNFRSLVEQPA